MKSSLELAKSKIEEYFDISERKVYRRADLRDVLFLKGDVWKLAPSVRFNKFINFLVNETKLTEVRLDFKRPELRYTWGEASVYELVRSLKDLSFFSHHTAAYFNGLTDYEPNNVYINSEQSRRVPKGILTQEGIDRAFKSAGRTTKNFAHYSGKTIWQVSSMGKGHYGVVVRSFTEYGFLAITNVERTLVDMTVRPFYSGGVGDVLNAYRRAKDRFNLKCLAETLRGMDFVYPFHQAVGFYLEKAGGYQESELEIFLQAGLEYDFYLTYGMQDVLYSKKWRLYYPANL